MFALRVSATISRAQGGVAIATGKKSLGFETAVEPLRDREVGAAGQVVARACENDPCFSYVFPDPDTRLRCLEAFFGYGVRHGHLFGEVTTARSLDGVMVVYRSDELDQHSEEERDSASDWASVEHELGEEACRRLTTEFFDRIFAAASSALHEHLGYGYWELDLLAVDPDRQGQGVGSTLLRHLNDRADQAGVQLGLITFNPRNVPLYQRHGYEVVAHRTDQPSGVRWWSMRRMAQTGQPRRGGASL